MPWGKVWARWLLMSRDMVYEIVPQVNRRTGDALLGGANNATIICGRDRMGPVDSGYGSLTGPGAGKSAGAIHLIAGRTDGDPFVDTDAATLYLSQRTDPDDQAGTQSVGSPQRSVSGAVLRADCVRIVPRTDFKVSVGRAYILIDSSGNITLEGTRISHGANAAQQMLLGTAFQAFWSTVVVTTPNGPGSLATPLPDSLLSSVNLLK